MSEPENTTGPDQASSSTGAQDSAGQGSGSSAPKLLDQAELEALLKQFQQEQADQARAKQEQKDSSASDLLDQRELDELLATEAKTTSEYVDKVIGQETSTDSNAESAISLTQEELDELVKELNQEKPLGGATELDEELSQKSATESPGGDVSLSTIDIAARAEKQEISAENVASATPEEDALLSQDLLDTLLSEAQIAKEESQVRQVTVPPPAPEPSSLAKEDKKESPPVSGGEEEILRKDFKKRLPVNQILKISASLAAGLLCALMSYKMLSGITYRTPSVETISTGERDDLSYAIETAKFSIASGEYTKAIYILDKALADAPQQHPLYPEAEFYRLSARVYGVVPLPTLRQVEVLQEEIDEFIKKYPGSRRAPEALRWKAQLYQKANSPELSFGVYRQLLEENAAIPDEDAVLQEAFQLAMDLHQVNEAMRYAQRLLDKYPQSRYVPNAKLVLAEVYVRNGNLNAARQLYSTLVEEQMHSSVGVAAVSRLAQLEIDAGRYARAVELLTNFLQSTNIISGGEQIQLMLAQVHKKMGDFTKAEQILRDLIAFFPDSPTLPKAYVELADVLDQSGRRREASRVISQAALRYSSDPDVMKMLGKLLAAQGDVLGAADALISAEESGARDPSLLLEAAQYLRSAGQLEKALEVYDKLIMNYPTDLAALYARVESAKTFHEQGKFRKAFQKMYDLALLTQGKPQHAHVLKGLAELYEATGLSSHAASTYIELARVAPDNTLKTQAIQGALRNGAIDEGVVLAREVNYESLSEPDAYNFLIAYGKALLKTDPQQGMEKLELAYDQYPNSRKPEDTLFLLQTMLARNQTSRVKEIVADLQGVAKQNPVVLPVYQQAALAWGDYLFDAGQFSDAVQVYADVPALSEGEDTAKVWAQFQLGSALLQMKDYDRAVPILEEVANSKSSWATYAQLKLEYAKLEQAIQKEYPLLLSSAGQMSGS